jgi:NAD(P)-dependent dehydrogenase (short-subunit alcohol dehydrogenase family)
VRGSLAVNERLSYDTGSEPVAKGNIYNPPADLVASKRILITGANSGLGLESAKRLAQAGARLVITARTQAKVDAAVAEVKAIRPTADVVGLVLDLASLDSIRSFPAKYDEDVGAPLDVLLANAGVMAIPERRTTSDGFERQVGVNHLGHFALVSTMMPQLKKAANGFRIVSVSSSGHRIANEKSLKDALSSDLDPKYSQWGSYGLSKAANILFTNELQRRFDAAGVSASAVSLHPGVVGTNLGRYLTQDVETAEAGAEGTDAENPILKALQQVLSPIQNAFLLTPEQGANTQVFLAAGADSDGDLAKGGALYFEDMGVGSPASYTYNQDLAEKLWEVSERLTGSKIDV